MKREAIATGAFTILMITACAWVGIATYVPESHRAAGFVGIFDTFQVMAQVILVVIGLVVGLGAVVGAVILAYYAYTHGAMWQASTRVKNAEALKALREAQLVLTVAPHNHQIIATVFGSDGALVHQPVHLIGGADAIRWIEAGHAHNGDSHNAQLLLPGPTEQQLPEYVDLAQYVPGVTSLRSVFLGVGRINGNVQPVSAPLESLVHIATGGASGFGKSTFMQALAYQIINARELPRLVMLDPQAVTFSCFLGDDRLLYPVASEPSMIAVILAELVKEMQRRQHLFGHWRGVQNLSQYNRVVAQEERLFPIPVLFDEFGLVADDKRIAKSAKLLSAGGRKSGISLIVGTQHWGHDDVSTAFRANLSTAIQFSARDKSESRILLNDSVAASITRRGQAFCRLPGKAGVIELQAPDPATLVGGEPELLPVSEWNRPEVIDRLDGDSGETEQRIMEMWDNEPRPSFNEMARQIYGVSGGKQTRLIREVLIQNGVDL